jgi:hypothetical protein
MRAALPLSERVSAVVDECQRLEQSIVALVVVQVAGRFKVSAAEIMRTSRGGQGAVLVAKARARDCAISMLVTGGGWPGPRAGAAFGLDKRAVSKCVSRVGDARDEDPALDLWLEACERALQGRFE